jgi:hypothetical protein
MAYVFNDGGKAATGRKGKSGDCVARAIAIANGIDYEAVYAMLARLSAAQGGKRSARNGVEHVVSRAALTDLGWAWVPAPKFVGRKARCADLAGKGTVIAKQAKHLVAVIDGTPHDIFDSSTKMVYGYWIKID